ncbi:MAG: UvrD-helicase domain-containing protein [Elusimicrobiaceae bacterium]|nr:UvrD-helicase domain-containing protein [Elusimicrobiaceae bacterium]
MNQDFLKTLNSAQLEAVNYTGGPCLIIAGAGTGKTKTLTCKIAKLIQDGMPPYKILAVTFTNKAAKEMRERLNMLVGGVAGQIWIYTFHSFALRILRQNAEAAKLVRDFVIYDETEQKKVVSLCLEEMGVKDAKKEVSYYVSIISRAKDEMLSVEDFLAQAVASNNEKKMQVAEVYRRYQAKLDASYALDFGDLLFKTVLLLKNNQEVREYYQQFFKYILVDEYQDTNKTQYLLTSVLAQKHRNLCVVGDPDQSIYSWRGANIKNILNFERDFKDAKVITLEENYRSTQIILDASNKLIKQNKNRKEKSLHTSKEGGEPIIVRELPSEGEEARFVANQVQMMVDDDGANLNDIAVFYRTNAQSRNFEDTFRRYQIPYRLIGAVKFYDRKEIKDILSYAKLLVNPSDSVSLLRIINTPRRSIGNTTIAALLAYAQKNNITLWTALKQQNFIDGIKPTALRGIKEFVNLIDGLTLEKEMLAPSETIAKLLELSGYQKSIEDEMEKDPEAAQRIGNLNELVNAVKEYEERCIKDKTAPTLSGYLQEISLITAEEEGAEQSGGAVTLMTVHLAKGLEFPTVFVTGLEEGLFPLSSKDEDELEEERRLCYVAMTRAKKNLFMTYAATRRIFGKTYENFASRFLYDSGLLEEEAYQPRERQEVAFRGKPRGGNYYGKYNHFTTNTTYNNAANYQDDDDFSYTPYKTTAPQTATFTTEKSAPTPAPINASSGVKIGTVIKHGVFGLGKVVLITGSGEAAKITVIFNNGTKRVFMLKYAPLEIVRK